MISKKFVRLDFVDHGIMTLHATKITQNGL